MKVPISFCCSGVALGGYVAASEWSNVQVERPRTSTSGGQSSGSFAGVGAGSFEVVEAARPRPAVAEAKVAKELQVRHLVVNVSLVSVGGFRGELVRLAVFVEDDLFAVDGGNFKGSAAGSIRGWLRLLLLGFFSLPIENIGHDCGGDCFVVWSLDVEVNFSSIFRSTFSSC